MPGRNADVLEQVNGIGGHLGLPSELRRDVTMLAVDIGERNQRDDLRYRHLRDASDFIASALCDAGHVPVRHEYAARGRMVDNIEVEIEGVERPEEIIVVGAHYDSAEKSPGANDNATGVAALLWLARAFASERPVRTIRFVAFTNEERPFTRSPEMGSLVYAERCRENGDQVVAMLSLETIGYYYGRRGREAPFPLNLMSPWRGDYLAVVANRASRTLSDDVLASFGPAPGVRVKRAILSGLIPGVKSSDHWSFWQNQYPAVMLTDTAPLRYRHYHRPSDTIDKIDFDRLAGVVAGVGRAVDGLVNPSVGEPAVRPVIS
jgi:hypothetical protein